MEPHTCSISVIDLEAILSQVKNEDLSKRISQLMWKSISLNISKPVNRREYTMDKFILKLIVIFSGISTGNASDKDYESFILDPCQTHVKCNFIFLLFR